MKKLCIGILVASSIFSMSVARNPVAAIDFAAEEDKYIKLCSSSSLTSANKQVCEDFNDYLSKKNSDLQKELNSNKSDLKETTSTISTVSAQINTIANDLAQLQKEINYLLTSIKNVETNIKNKEEEMRDRLYIMQSDYNTNHFIEYLFGSENFTDFFSRISTLNDITAYEKELIEELTRQKKSLETQRAAVQEAEKSLQAKKNTQVALQDKLIALKVEQQQAIKDNQTESNKVTAAQAKIDAALSALMDNAPSTGGGSYVPGSSAVGNAIAQKALTRLGMRYWWGAPGGGYGDGQGLDNPNAKYFDCSGLVAWAHRQSGVMIGRKTSASYANSGTRVTRSQLQAGDVITFNYGSGVQHIGIYIGGGSFVHAAGNGSGTRGQYPNQCVKVASLSGYWEKYVYNYRRLY